MKYNISKFMGSNKSSYKGKFIVINTYPQETRKISNKQCNFTPQLNLKQKNEKSPKLVLL